MQTIALQAVPNQSLTVQLDGHVFALTIKECLGGMIVTVERDGKTMITSSRAVAGTPILPYEYLMAGNFLFLTAGEALPYYTDFGGTCALVYLTQAEIDAL